MTLLKFLVILFSMGIVTFIAGFIIVKREAHKKDYLDSVIFMRELIRSSELSVTAYRNILDAFRDFDVMHYRDRTAYKKLMAEFLFKYKKFLPDDPDEPKIKVIK